MELQKEQMRIQQEQFAKNVQEQRERFEAQQAAAQAQAPVVPEPIAEAAASATEVAPAPLADPSAQGANAATGANAALLSIGQVMLAGTGLNKAGTNRRRYRTDLVPGAGGSGSLSIPNT